MNILILNLILSTPEKGVIKKRDSISDTMICSFARGFVALGHSVTIVAAEEFRPTGQLPEDVEMVFLPSRMPKVFNPSLLPWPIGLGKGYTAVFVKHYVGGVYRAASAFFYYVYGLYKRFRIYCGIVLCAVVGIS